MYVTAAKARQNGLHSTLGQDTINGGLVKDEITQTKRKWEEKRRE